MPAPSNRRPSSWPFSWLAGLLIVAGLLILPDAGSCYNIDLPSYVQHRITQNAMFGFSIAFHKGYSGYQQVNSLIVGAPKFDTSNYQYQVREGGAVFRCGMTDNECGLVKFDTSGNNVNTLNETIDNKSHQWLGATVVTSRDKDFVMACAPRYVYHSMNPQRTYRVDPIGTCFTSTNFTTFTEVSPCRTNFWGYHRQGFCQAGFSAAVSSKGDRFYIGAPGAWYWQGQAYSVSPDVTFPYKPSYYQPFGSGGQAFSHDVIQNQEKHQVYETLEGGQKDDDSYLGYSMTTGDFNGDGVEDVAIGMPRGAELTGKIVVNTWNMLNIFNVTGKQIGEYFGYALASCDVDGNGLDDLIIGAPMYSEPGNTEGNYDVGRVYVLLQNGIGETEHIRDGFSAKGRFGLSLAALGDINRDGYGDFAVGAPYDGPEGRGVVYIYHGSATGPREKPSQIIKSEDLVEVGRYPPYTFGFSLAGGADMDGNGYPDIAVGAYLSDQVFIFKSRPVAAVTATTKFLSHSKLISLEERNCQLREGKAVPCADILTCWSYNGENLPGSLNFEVSWVLDVKKPKFPRMYFLRDEGRNIRNSTVQLYQGQQYCRNETVYLVDNLQDKLTPLEVEMRYNLRSSRPAGSLVRTRREVLEPVIDQNREIVLRDALNIQKNCGADNICEPDLNLQINTVDKYLLGSQKPLVIEVIITNDNEDAFEAAFYMVMPKDLDYINIDKGDMPISCVGPSEKNNNTLKCNIGNPLPAKKVAKFNVIMLPSQKIGMAPSYDFFMEANSTNVEKPGSHFNNIIRKSIGIWVETDLSIEGVSLPESELYKAADFKAIENATTEAELGPHVVHLYNVLNKGPSAIEEAVILIHYPYQTIAGDYLMYMTSQPETDGNIVCEPHVMVNSRNLQLDAALQKKSFLEQRGVVRTAEGGQSSASTNILIHKSEGGSHGGSSHGVTSTSTSHKITEEERRRLEKEDEQDAPGDASLVHSHRANVAAANSGSSAGSYAGGAGSAGGGGTGGGSTTTWSSSSWNSSNPSVIVRTKESSTHYDASGRPHVVETSTEYVQGLELSPGGYNRQHSSSSYQQMPQRAGIAATTYSQGPQQVVGRQESHVNYGSPNFEAERRVYQQQQQQPSSSQQQQYAQQHQQRFGQQGVGQQGFAQQQGVGQQGFAQQQQYAQQQQQPLPKTGHGFGHAVTYNDGSASVEKAAQGRQGGFQTGTLDLGMLNRNNIDNELKHHESAGGADGSNTAGTWGYQKTYSSGAPQGGGNAYHQSSSYSSYGGQPYYGTENHPEYQQTHRRVRRDGETTDAEAIKQVDLESPCQAARCETLRCVAKNLGMDDGVWIAIRMRMVAKTMEKLASNVPLNVSTMAIAHVTRLPYIGEPKDPIVKTHEIFFKAVPEPTPVPDVVPLWVVVLAACVGALILLLLILCLYKCGFFKRNRPAGQTMEHQPLRNGYHGDEHL